MKIYIITYSDFEYGYDIFVDVAKSPEEALEICNKRKQHLECFEPLSLSPDKTQIYSGKAGYHTTEYFITEREI